MTAQAQPRGQRLLRASYVGGPTDDEFPIIDPVAATADELETTSAAAALAWLQAREDTVIPIDGESPTVHSPLLQSDARY